MPFFPAKGILDHVQVSLKRRALSASLLWVILVVWYTTDQLKAHFLLDGLDAILEAQGPQHPGQKGSS